MPTNKKHNFIASLIILSVIFTIFSIVYFVNYQIPHLKRILNRGELIAATRNGPTTYYESNEGKAGLEYELLKLFSDSLGVKLKIIVPESFSDILPMVANERVDIAAAGLSITWPRKEDFEFGPSYQEIKPQVIYHKKKNKKTRKVEDLIGKKLVVIKGSSHVDQLKALAIDNPNLVWSEDDSRSSEELMMMVNDKEIDFTIADSNEFSLINRFNTHLKSAFDLSKSQKLAWVIAKKEDKSLKTAVDKFFKKLQESGHLTQILENYYGHMRGFNIINTQEFMRQIKNKLGNYQNVFYDIAKKYNIDWKLLAAVSYQESHWDPKAVSPTGVRGMMMLTESTAGQMGIKNRLDALQSLDGGVRYLKEIEKKFNERITNPDRLWFTLASYNVGYGHLEDARILTQKEGKNPDSWSDVKLYLSKLTQKRWYKKTKYGYARGNEAVHYVQNIRRYFDLLSWYEKKQSPTLKPEKNKTIIQTLPKTL